MSEVTQLIEAIGQGQAQAADQLLPLVYDELRRLARARMGHERSDHTLQATALVHEAYLRLVDNPVPQWEGRGHFFAAAAEAMRRILVEHARTKNSLKRGGNRLRSELGSHEQTASSNLDVTDVLALDEALTNLATEAPAKAELVKLRYFAGLSLTEAADAMNISEATAKRYWVFSRAWLFQALESQEQTGDRGIIEPSG